MLIQTIQVKVKVLFVKSKQRYCSGVLGSVEAVLQKSFAQMWTKRVEDDQPCIS